MRLNSLVPDLLRPQRLRRPAPNGGEIHNPLRYSSQKRARPAAGSSHAAARGARSRFPRCSAQRNTPPGGGYLDGTATDDLNISCEPAGATAGRADSIPDVGAWATMAAEGLGDALADDADLAVDAVRA